jgi:hypothetical protein
MMRVDEFKCVLAARSRLRLQSRSDEDSSRQIVVRTSTELV